MAIFSGFTSELAATRRVAEERHQREEAKKNIDPMAVMRMREIRRQHPNIGPTTTLALAKSGHDAASPVAFEVSKLEEKKKKRSNLWWLHDTLGASREWFLSKPEITKEQRAALENFEWFLRPVDIVAEFGPAGPPLPGPTRVSTKKEQKLSERAASIQRKITPEELDLVVELLDPRVVNFNNPEAVERAWLDYLAPDRPVDKGSGLGNFLKMSQTATGAVADVVPGLKPVARGGFLALETLGQEAIGSIRQAKQLITGPSQPLTKEESELGGVTGGTPQSNAGVILEAWKRGDEIPSVGKGYVIGGEVRRQQAANARAEWSVGGKAWTLGRGSASLVWEPGSKEYNRYSGIVDLGAQIVDPTALALGKVGKLRRAAKVFSPVERAENLEKAGLYNTFRKVFIPQTFDQWVAGPQGRNATGYLRAQTDIEDIRKIVGGDAELAYDLSRAETDVAVVEALRPKAVGGTLREIPKVPAGAPPPSPLLGYGYTVQKRGPRFAEMMPAQMAPADDIDKVVATAARYQRNAKVSEEIISRTSADLVEAYRKGGPALYEAVTQKVYKNAGDALKTADVKNSDVYRLTRGWINDYEKGVAFAADQEGRNVVPPWIDVDDAAVPLPKPIDINEFLSRGIPFPNTREIRQVTSKLAPLYDAKFLGAGIKGSTRFLDFVYSSVLIPAALIRPAWVVRVIGEEQLRMAAAGYDSMWNHPISYIAWVVGRKKNMLGEDFLKEAVESGYKNPFGQAMAGGLRNLHDDAPDTVRLAKRTFYGRRDVPFVGSWAEEAAKRHRSPILSNIAAREPDDAKEWFWTVGQKWRKQLAAQTGAAKLLKREGSDETVEFFIDEIKKLAGDDPEIIQAIATGKIAGQSLTKARYAKHIPVGAPKINPKAREVFQTKFEQGIGPNYMPGDELIHGGQKAKSGWDAGVRWAMDHLMTQNTNKLSRQVVFKQAYWNRSIENIGNYTPEAQRVAIAEAKAAKIPRKTIRQLEENAKLSSGQVTYELGDGVSKAYALDVVQELLYDLTQRGQFFDAMRLVFPFGDAWKEVVTRWAKIGIENPQTVRRGQQLVEGARGAGFFYTDPQTGQEMFGYKGTEAISEKLLGVPIPLAGSVQGSNLIGNGLPGLGWGPQVAAAEILPDTPDWDWVREIVLPYGKPGGAEDVDILTRIFEGSTPAWLDRIRTALGSPTSQRDFGNTVMQIQRYKKSTGDYGDTVEEQRRLFEESKTAAKKFYIFRAFASGLAPSAPTPVWQVEDKAGHLLMTSSLASEFAELQDKDFDTAVEKFIEKYGEDAATLIMQSLTQTVPITLPSTKRQVDWDRANPWAQEKYPNTYGLFAPPARKNERYDPEGYNRQLARGERIPIKDGVIAQRFANHRKAAAQYDQLKEKVGDDPTDEDREWLREWKAHLEKKYPGYNSEVGRVGRADQTEVVRELRKATNDERLKDNPAVSAIRTYLEKRDLAQQEADDRDRASFNQSEDTADLRGWLADWRDRIAKDYPPFAKIAAMVFRTDFGEE